MGRMKENPRYDLLSVRVTEEEWQKVYEKAKNNKQSLSEYIRIKILS